jgi:NAD(P)-dependent dehydrogenase (short-subunit alcohol dehydrogenase family)
MSVENKVVLVTGAARGMGREFTRGFLKEGANVVATDLSWQPTGASSDDYDFAAELDGNPRVLTDVMDITLQAHVDRVYERAIAQFGRIDVIVNNAGMRQRDIYPPHGSVTILETDVNDWQRMFDTHVFGTLRVVKRFTKPMLAQNRGSIINICSGMIQRQTGTSREGAYQPAKAALAVMTVYLATELKQYNIAANVLLPGHTRTSGSDEQEVARREIRERLGSGGYVPIRVRPDNAVPLALFLAEQDAGGTTGEMISALEWNKEHELGGVETWGYGPDLDAARAAGRL